MTTTDEELELRLRRDLAELGALPATLPRARIATRRTRPVRTMAVAVTVVLALVAASVAIVWNTGHHGSSVAGPSPRVHTILDQPSDLTGSGESIAAKPFNQICEKWRELASGTDCSNLQARYVWSPGATKGPYTFSVIEVVGRRDLKLANEGRVKSAWPLFKIVSVRGHHARLFGMSDVGEAGDVVTMVWNERADLQVWIHLQVDPAARRYPTALTNEIIAFARGMRPVPIDSGTTDYVLRSGHATLLYRSASSPTLGELRQRVLRRVTWRLTWHAADHRLCASVETASTCSVPSRSTATVHARSMRLDGCGGDWVGTDGLVFGIAPERTRRITIPYIGQSKETGFRVTTELVAPPGAPQLRVFAVAIEIVHPRSAAVIAQGGDGAALPRAFQDPHKLPPFRNAC